MKNIAIFLTIFSLISLGCQKHPLQQLGLTSVSQKVDRYKLKGGDTIVVDILFVVDNSNSMLEEQSKVAQNVSNFMRNIQAKGEKTDYHIGVITHSVWDQTQGLGDPGTNARAALIKNFEDGRLQKIVMSDPGEPGDPSFNINVCKFNGSDDDMAYTHPSGARDQSKTFLTNSDDIGNDVVALLSNTVKCLGTGGAIIERGFDAIEKAFSPERSLDNAGFLRSDAKLMVIVISDEEDCSTGIESDDISIASARSLDCTEQSPNIPRASTQVTSLSDSKQNKLKSVDHYIDFLVNLKGGDPTQVGFAAIVGPERCWTGGINDMGIAPASDINAPYPQQNCEYSNLALSVYYDDNFSTCENNLLTCSCTPGAEDECATYDLFTTCYNSEDGRPNRLPYVDTEHPCSEAYLHGYCDAGYHCEVTLSGVKCEEDDCPTTGPCPSGEVCCPAGKVCNSGACVDQTPASYGEKDSYATAGKRYIKAANNLKERLSKDIYQFPICLEDFGTPLSLIGAKLADAKCEYALQSKTDDPCNLIIKIFPPEEQSLPEGLNSETSLGNPWTYTLNGENPEITEESLIQFCEDNRGKPFSERVDITQYLEKVPCGKDGDGDIECLKILFPENLGICPQPGSSVEIYYGVIQ